MSVQPIYFGDKRLPDRFWSKALPEPNSGCWLWHASTTEKGYGQFYDSEHDRLERAHRYSYRHLVGPLSANEHGCHRCDLPACVNPAHIFPGTPLINTADMVTKGRHKPAPRRGTHCRAGHELTPENSLAKGGCRTCKRDRYHERKFS